MLRGKERERRRGRGGGLVKRDRRGKGVCRGCGGGGGLLEGEGERVCLGMCSLVMEGKCLLKGKMKEECFPFLRRERDVCR